MKHTHFNRLLSMLLVVATLCGLLVVPSSAASLSNSRTVTIKFQDRKEYLSKSTGGTLGGSSWGYTSNDGLTGTAYCVNWGLTAVSPSKALPLVEYNRNPQTMGVYANGYPMRSLEQFKQLHQDDVRGINGLTEAEYRYATQVAIWSSCGQLAVNGTPFTAGRASLVEPTADAQQIRIYDSVNAILRLCADWKNNMYTGMSIRAEENMDIRGVEILNEYGLEGAAEDHEDGIEKETINGKEYYTRVVYLASATSTWIDGYTTKVYSTDAPAGTIFVAENNSLLETVQENGATCYKVDTSTIRRTNLNSNGEEYYGVFKVCIPVDNVISEGSFTIKATGGVAQYNLFLANNTTSTEQSYIVADPGYTTVDAQIPFKWTGMDVPDTASLQVVKVGAGGSPLQGARFTLNGNKGTSVSGTTDRNGQIIWTGLPADEKYTLAETAAPEGYQIIAPMNVILSAGRTKYLTVADSVEQGFTIKKVDAQNKASLPGAVFLIEQIDGTFKTTRTTGFDGTVSFQGSELPYGSYRISEQSPPEGYVKSSRVETVQWDGTKDVTITWENARDVSLTVVKIDEYTGVSLPNATFDVYADGQLITSVTTNDAGEARVTGIQKEAYIELRETAAPTGYVLDRTSHGIHIDPYDPTIEDDPVLIITNRARPALRILKYDLTTNIPMPNVTFEVWHDGQSIGQYTTDDNGEIFLYDLEPGTYLVKEIATDDAHVVNSTPQQIELKAGDTQTRELVFFNSLKPGIHLIKVDSITMRSLPNVRFEFKKVGGSYRQEFTTDVNGEIDLSKLEPGAYEVHELEAPEGYLMDDSVRVVQINPDENANFVFTNTPKPSLRLIKTSSDGARLAGVHFRIARIEDGAHYLDRITDDHGEINISGLEPGVYSVQETATTADHVLDLREYHVELFPGRTSTIAIENQRRPNITIIKRDADTGEPVPNTVFLVEAADGHSVDEVKTDENGRAELKSLLPGVYEVTEKSVPSPYLLDAPSQLVTLYPNRDRTIYFENHKKPGLTVQKVDSITGDPIKGAKFRVWYASNNTLSGELNDLGYFYSNENGRFTIESIKDGWYRITEVEPAPGYAVKDPATQDIYLKAGESRTVVFENTPLSALVVWKFDSVTGRAVEGCVFQVRYLGGASGMGGTVIGTYRTSANGSFTVTGLKAGTYIVEEIASDTGHIIDSAPQTVYISGEDQDVVQLYFGDSPKGGLLIHKIDSVTHKPLSDVEFLITTSDGAVVGNSNGRFVTDSSGAILIGGLDPGSTLVVKETRTKDGYVLDDVPQVVKIKAGQTIPLEFRNAPMGNLIVVKLDSVTRQPLEGVEFELRYTDGSYVDNGKLSSLGRYFTDKNGQIIVPGIIGAVQVTEVATIPGYTIHEETRSQTVQINPDDTQKLIFYNDPIGGILIHKTDSITGLGIYGVKFLVYDQNGNPIGEYTTDDQGYIYIDDLTVQGRGKLFIRELEAAPGYELDKQYKTVYIQPGKTIEIEWENTPITGQIQVYKYAAEYNEVTGTPAGAPLQGAVYEISEARSGKVVDYITTDARGVAASGPLPLGRYKIVEVTAPAYWQVSGTIFDETLEYSGQIIKVSDYDRPSRLGVAITKRGNAEVLAGSQMRYDFTVANTSNVSLENFYWHDRIPTDAARAAVFTTGAYSARLNYRILYKTNYSAAYQVLASNLITSSSYSFSLNAIPTQTGEYVTDIYLDFGTVPVGFQSVANPTLTVTVSGAAVNGYQLVNRADVGGQYQGTWQTGQAAWVTIIRKLTPTVVPTLPKTGY